jgi:GNAT superfamily N-acetyltransferase
MIRPARRDEAAFLSDLALRSKAHWGYSAEFLAACRDELALSADAIAAGEVFALEVEGCVLGFHSLEHVSDAVVELGHLFVEPKAIGAGHGRALIGHARREAERRGYRVMVIQGDPNAEGFYAAIGARRIGARESASVPGRQLPLFELPLDFSRPCP